MQRTADYIARLFLGGEAAQSDLKNYILEYGEVMALAARDAEREACAKVAESLASVASGREHGDVVAMVAEELADAIRNRSER